MVILFITTSTLANPDTERRDHNPSGYCRFRISRSKMHRVRTILEVRSSELAYAHNNLFFFPTETVSDLPVLWSYYSTLHNDYVTTHSYVYLLLVACRRNIT